MSVQSTEQTKPYAITRRNGEFPNFSWGIIQEFEEYFLYDLENEEENKLLAAANLEDVNVTDKDDNHWKSGQKHRNKETDL